MARYFTAASAELLSTSTGVTAYGWPLTMTCRFYPVSDSHSALFVITNAATTQYSLLFQENAANGQDLRAQSDGGLSGVSISETGNWVQDTWNTAVGVFTSSTSRHVFLNGTKSTPDTSSTGTGTSWDTIRVGTLAPSFYMDGAICELAIWNVALTDQEAAEYHAGVCPLMIRPASLKHYWPLGGLLTADDADYDIVGGLQLTATNTPTTFDHPGGLIYPSSLPRIIVPAAGGGGATVGSLINGGLVNAGLINRGLL